MTAKISAAEKAIIEYVESDIARRLSENTNENLAARISLPPIFIAQP